MKRFYSFFENIIVLFLIAPFTFLLDYLIHISAPLSFTDALCNYGYLFVFGIFCIFFAYFTASDKFTLISKIFASLIPIIICQVIFYLITKKFQFSLLALSAFQIIFINKLTTVIILHDDFLDLCGEKTGLELRDHLYQNKFAAMDLGVEIEKTKKILYFLSVYVIITIIIEFFQKKFNLFLIINSAVFFINYIVIFYLLGYFKKEVYYLNEGLTNIIPERKRFYKSIFLIFIISILLGLAFAKDYAPIKLHLPSWLFGETHSVEQAYVPPPDNSVIDFPDNGFDAKPKVNNKFILFLEKLFDYITIILGFLARHTPSFLLSFLIVVLIVYKFQGFYFKRFALHIKELFKRMHMKFSSFIKHLLKKEVINDYAKVSKKEFINSVYKISRNSKKSREKRLELDRITRQFVKIIDYGTKLKIKYTKNLAPAEYTKLISDYLLKTPEMEQKAGACDLIGAIFEKALYDKNVITKKEEQDFTDAISKVISKNKG